MRSYNSRGTLLNTIIKNICRDGGRERNFTFETLFTVVKMSVSERKEGSEAVSIDRPLWAGLMKRHEGVVFRFCEAIFPSVALACFLVPRVYAFTIIDTAPKLSLIIVSSKKYIYLYDRFLKLFISEIRFM